MDIEKIYGQDKQQIADTVLADHKNYLSSNSDALVQAQVNYAFLSGNHNKMAVGGVLQDVYRQSDLLAKQQTNYSFDKIEDAMREIAPAFLEAIPGIGIIPTTTNPIQSENQDIAEKFIEYHKDKVWCAERLMMFDIMPNGYPGGAVYVMMYPRHVGTKRVAFKNGDPYLHHIIDGVEVPVKVNADNTLNVGGIDMPPEELGCEIRDRAETLMDLKVLTVFDVSIQGKLSRSLRDAYSVTVRTVKSIGEIKKLYPEADLKDFIDKLPEEQIDPPMDGVDKYLSEAGFGKPHYGTLRGNSRLVEVYQKFINPCADFESGAIITTLGSTSGGINPESTAYFLDIAEELPWKHPKTKKGLIPIAWFPFGFLRFGSAIPQSDIKKAEGAQRARDRIYNAAMALGAYQAQPPIFTPYGMEFSKNLTEWYDLTSYPAPGTREFYKKSTLPGMENEKPFTQLSVGMIDPKIIAMIDDQLAAALHTSSTVGKYPKSISGESAQIQYTIEQRDLAPMQKAHEQAWFELYELLIAAATTEYYKGQPFIIQEKDSFQILEWNQEIFGDDYDYVMVSKINKPVTKKARLEVLSTLVDFYSKLGTINPELASKFPLDRVFDMMDLTEMGLADNEKVPSQSKAKWELAKMLSGQEVAPPLVEDDHEMHMSVDLAEIQSVRFLSHDPRIQQMILEHDKLHRLELDTMNQLKMKQVQAESAAQEVGRQRLQIERQPVAGEPQNQEM